ncbi:hypothetical protein IAU60_005004 [Kwoniella sp. DSM 27419]
MGRAARSILGFTLVSLLAIITTGLPFVFNLVVSLSPGVIHTLSLARVTGHVPDGLTNTSLPVMISVGPTGGCMWFNATGGPPTRCIAHQPFIPDSGVLQLPSNQTVIGAFPVTLGRALVMNHVVVGLMGLSIVVALVDMLVLNGGISLIIVYFTILLMWITFILETTYIGVLHHRLDSHQTGFDYHIGPGYWLILVSVLIVSALTCGNGDSVEISLGGD